MINLNKTAKKCSEISKKREKNGGNVKITQIIKHLGTEVIELAQAEQIYVMNRVKDYQGDFRNEFEEELADVIICCLIEADLFDINIEKALKNKINKNKLRADKLGDKL